MHSFFWGSFRGGGCFKRGFENVARAIPQIVNCQPKKIVRDDIGSLENLEKEKCKQICATGGSRDNSDIDKIICDKKNIDNNPRNTRMKFHCVTCVRACIFYISLRTKCYEKVRFIYQFVLFLKNRIELNGFLLPPEVEVQC